MADVALQRKNMVESQVRPSDITDRRIVRAMLEIPREAFVPASSVAIAYGDLDVPLVPGAPGSGSPGSGPRTLMAARVFAKLVQLCDIEPYDDVLIVGAGMGYSAAVVAKLAKSVTALEVNETLATHARTALTNFGVAAADVVTGPLALGLTAKAPFDVIIIEGAAAHVPRPLLEQLSAGGRLAVITLNGASGKATLWRRHANGFDARDAFDAAASPLPGFDHAPAFSF